MSTCIKDLYDYDLVKNCSKYGILYLKSNFDRQNFLNVGLHPQCSSFRKIYCFCIRERKKEYYLENRDWIRVYKIQNRDQIEEYQIKIYDKISARQKIYSNNRYKTDINFRLICKTRSGIRQALNGKSKSISRKEILGKDIDTYRKRIEFHFTPEMNWLKIRIDHVKPICLFDVSKDEELKETLNWKSTQTLLKEIVSQKRVKYNFLVYHLQFIKAYQFIKLNDQRGFNENLHWWIIK